MRRITLLMAIAALVAACGGSDGGSDGDGGGDPDEVAACSLVSAEEAEDILDAPVTVETYEGPFGPDPVGCDYETEEGAIVLTQVQVGSQYQADIADYPDATVLSGLGDEAFLTGDGAVRVSKGDWAFSAARITGDVTDEQLEAFVRVMNTHLP